MNWLHAWPSGARGVAANHPKTTTHQSGRIGEAWRRARSSLVRIGGLERGPSQPADPGESERSGSDAGDSGTEEVPGEEACI